MIKSNMQRNKLFFNIAFLLPTSILYIMFVLLPFLQGIPYSLRSWDGFSATYELVGLQNYINLLTDGNILPSLMNTVVFTLCTVIGSNLIGLILALGIQKSSIYNSILRTIFFLPFVISLVLASYIWSYIFSDVLYGLLAIKSPLGNASQVLYGLAIISIWKDSGYCMIIYLASLKMVPQDYYEVAKIEGSGRIHTFLHVTLPLIVPAFTANITIVLAWGFKVFEYPMIATGGGPGKASETLAMFVHKNIFEFYKAGYGQAAAILFTLLLGVLSFSVTAILRKREVEM